MQGKIEKRTAGRLQREAPPERYPDWKNPITANQQKLVNFLSEPRMAEEIAKHMKTSVGNVRSYMAKTARKGVVIRSIFEHGKPTLYVVDAAPTKSEQEFVETIYAWLDETLGQLSSRERQFTSEVLAAVLAELKKRNIKLG